ncbi:MAG: DNA-processing protein DprA [Anaerolineae bacterium]
MEEQDELKYWVGFNIVPGIGSVRFRALLERFGSAARAWHASPQELKQLGLDNRVVNNLLEARTKLSLEKEMEKIRRTKARVITWDDEEYPPHLKNIYAPPPLLYIKGEIRPEDRWAVAMVGTRRATVYGKEATRFLAGGLARNGVTVISGLARGIDSQAHRAALEAGGRTIAVLGHGIDQVYPPEHRELAEAITRQGALLSDYPLGTKPESRNFPPRNRLISGMALGVVIVEGSRQSGAMITASFATEQDREVFAVPGHILSHSSEGPNYLIQNGAKLVSSVEDILEELNLVEIYQQQELQALIPGDETEAVLLRYLSREPVHVDEMVRQSGLPTPQVTSTLALMELKGMVRQVGGMNYVLARESRVDYVVE